MIENSMTLKEREKILKHLQTKTTTFTQIHVLKDAMEAHEKLEQIEQIVGQVESLNPEVAIGDREGIRKIREILEEE